MNFSRHMSVLFALLMTAGTAASQSGEGEWLSYRDAYRAMVVFEKYGRPKNLIQQHLQVVPKDKTASIEGLQLTLQGKSTQLDLPLDAIGRARFPLLKAAYDENAVLMLNRGAGQYEFRQRVSILLQADGVYEVADMRAACEQALTFRRMVDASARTRRCVGVRFVYARALPGAGVRLRTAGGEGVSLPVQDGPAFGDESNAQFKVVNYRFGEPGDGGQLVTPHAPLAIAPLTE